jgi:hypothetical protein
MSPDPGSTHYVGDECRPAHDPRIDQAHTSTVLCKPCRTYHLDHAVELRAEVERLTLADRQWADHVKRLSEEVERLRALIDKHNDECRECPVIELDSDKAN